MVEKKNKLVSRNPEESLQERLEHAKALTPSEVTSDYLRHSHVTLQPHHAATGKTKHYQGSLSTQGLERGAELQTPYQLLIAQLPPNKGYYLLYLDEEGYEITDTYHDTLELALAQAQWEFGIGAQDWENFELNESE